MILPRSVLLATVALLAGCASQTMAPPAAVPAPPPAAAATMRGLDDPAPDPMRWTYASGEAAGASIQAWRALADFAIATAARKPAVSVPMGLPDVAGGVGTLACNGKKPAVVVDVDETVVLNQGLEYWLARGNPSSSAVSEAWFNSSGSAVAPVPGAVTGIRRLRAAGIAVIYNSNRPSNAAAGTIRALQAAGAGSAVHGQDLFLLGDDALGGNKDGRRRTIAERFCVVALGGDNLGDFATTLNDPAQSVQQRRERSARGDLAALWGNGWFMIPNAAYGAWQKGTVSDVFPPDSRWEPNTPRAAAPDIMSKDK